MRSTIQVLASTEEVFTEHCGYRVGRSAFLSFPAVWPSGSIDLRLGQLKLFCITRHFVFPTSAVTRVSVYFGLLSVGVRLEHTIADYPRFIAFWTEAPDELIRRLKGASFPFQ